MPIIPLEDWCLLSVQILWAGMEGTVEGTKSQSPVQPPPALFLPRDMDHVRLLVRWLIIAVVLGSISACVVHGVRELLLFSCGPIE